MTPAVALQALGLVMLIVGLAWLLGPWFLIVASVLFLVVPEFTGRGKR